MTCERCKCEIGDAPSFTTIGGITYHVAESNCMNALLVRVARLEAACREGLHELARQGPNDGKSMAMARINAAIYQAKEPPR